MKQILQYFTPVGKLSKFEKQKINAFIISGTIGIFLVLIIRIQALLSVGDKSSGSFVIGISVITFVLINLFILKYKGIKLTGNIFSIGIVVLLSISLHILKADIPAMAKFTKNFYLVLAILTIGALFASKRILLLNAVIILASTTRVYLYALEQTPEQAKVLQSAYANHSVAIVIIAMIIYFTIQFSENALADAKKDAEIKDGQNKKLSTMFSTIKSTSNLLGQLSKEINGSANSLSSNASEQAANVEEISATMEEMTGSIIQNAENTQTTAQSINSTTEFSKKSDKVIANSLSAIQNINSKIGMIQDIAFQTNILAINAAIEAASAGEAGKGFSVVASEVKKLADHSNKAAKEIEDLITVAMQESDKAGDYQKKISEDIKNVNQVVNEISAASSEQKNSIEQINNSISQINEGAQENAAISEGLAASVNNLALHAEKLNKLLNSA